MRDGIDGREVACVDCGSTDCDPPMSQLHDGFSLWGGDTRKSGRWDVPLPTRFRCNECGFVWAT